MQIVQDVFSENYKTLLREIKEDLDTPYSWIRKLHTVKVSIPLKLYSECNPNQNPRRLYRNRYAGFKFLNLYAKYLE